MRTSGVVHTKWRSAGLGGNQGGRYNRLGDGDTKTMWKHVLKLRTESSGYLFMAVINIRSFDDTRG